jgi:hypothetical protein
MMPGPAHIAACQAGAQPHASNILFDPVAFAQPIPFSANNGLFLFSDWPSELNELQCMATLALTLP